MTTKELRGIGEALVALSEGNTVQHRDWKGDWSDVNHCGFLENATGIAGMWRVKPERKKRLMCADEFPAMFWLISPDQLDDIPTYFFMIHAIQGESIITAGSSETIASMGKRGYKWSPDRKEIRSFYTEDI